MTDPVDFIPAGPTCCCEQASWLGRRAPRYQPHGSFHRSPPHAPPQPIAAEQFSVEPALWRGVRAALIITAICGFTMWAIIHFWPV